MLCENVERGSRNDGYGNPFQCNIIAKESHFSLIMWEKKKKLKTKAHKVMCRNDSESSWIDDADVFIFLYFFLQHTHIWDSVES